MHLIQIRIWRLIPVCQSSQQPFYLKKTILASNHFIWKASGHSESWKKYDLARGQNKHALEDLLGLKGEGDDSCRQWGRGRGACVGVCALLPEVCSDLKQEIERDNISHHWYENSNYSRWEHNTNMAMKSLHFSKLFFYVSWGALLILEGFLHQNLSELCNKRPFSTLT